MVRTSWNATESRQLLRSVLGIVQQAASLARRATHSSKTRRRKTAGDFVTQVDLRCERWLRRKLLSLRRDSGFLGEETAPMGLDREEVWVVDPIDGTSNYANGLFPWAVAVALLRHRKPELAAICVEPEGHRYAAIRGQGAWRNGRRMPPPRPSWNDGSILGCQWTPGSAAGGLLAALQSRGARIRAYGSTVSQLLDVASGKLDGNVQTQGRLWDLAAPSLVAEEVGARVTDWSGNAIFPVRTLDAAHHASIVAMPRVHRSVLQALAEGGLVVPRG